MSFTQSYFFGSKFFWNYGFIVGGGIGLTQQSFAYIENALFYYCSAARGGAISLNEESSATILNSTFIGNFANEGGVVHSVEDYHATMTISNSTFVNNYGDLNLFNGLDSNFVLINSTLTNNTNMVFSLMRSSLVLDGVSITNHSCSTNYKGCISNGLLTTMNVNNLSINAINTILEDVAGFYLDTSSGEFSNVSFENLESLKHVGNCFYLLNSSLAVTVGNFLNYEQNCFSAQNSSLLVENTYFNNENSATQIILTTFGFGTIYCETCWKFILSNSFLIMNKLSNIGGAVSLISDPGDDFNISAKFYNVSFIDNQAFDLGGAVYLSNVHSTFNFCNFTQNKADKGAAIYFYSLGNFLPNLLFFIDILISFITKKVAAHK